MKKTIYTLLAALLLTISATAQSLNITDTEGIVYQFLAANMTESSAAAFGADENSVTINGKTFYFTGISSMIAKSTSDVENNTVNIVYSGTTATVTIAGNVAPYVTATVSGAHVTIVQSNTDAVDGDEITYVLSGTTTDGEFALSGSYKCTVSLAGLTLTNPSGAAINITNGKRIQISAKNGTVNTLTDGVGGSQKGCIYSKGQIQLQGKGTLNVIGNTKHAVKSGDYITVKNLTLNIMSAVGDGISCNEYFQMKSGTVNISGVGDDGIQCDLDGTTSTGETADHEDEDSGNIYIEGGTLNISVTGNATWDSEDSEVKGTKCLSADGDMKISGGTLTLTNSGSGGKGIKVDGALTISDNANITVTTTGLIAYCASTSNTTIQTATSSESKVSGSNKNIGDLDDALKTSPKGIKVDGAMTISGGTTVVSAKYHEAIETKSTLEISGGYVYAESGDDAINSSSHMTISGGYVMANSSGNDGLDANGNMYITGGNVFAIAKTTPEVGLDANTEGGYKLYISGGNVVAIGGFENNASITNGTAKSASYTKGAWYGLSNGSTQAFAFKVPSNSSMGSTMAIYTTGTPALSKGVTGSGTSFWNTNGYSSFSGGSSVSLSNYSSGSGPGGGGPGGGGGHW
jgi:hypothetical protein